MMSGERCISFYIHMYIYVLTYMCVYRYIYVAYLEGTDLIGTQSVNSETVLVYIGSNPLLQTATSTVF